MSALAAHTHVQSADLVDRAVSCLAAATVTALLVALSWLNAIHSPVFDSLRAGAYLLRSRRGSMVSIVRVEHSPPPAALCLVVTPTAAKEDAHV